MMEEFYNPALSAAIVSWLIAQIIKVVLYSIKFREVSLERLIGSGGMPSSHSATVCALTVVIARINGINSSELAIAAALALVVMYDATGVRRAAGQHAKEINSIRLFMFDNWFKPATPKENTVEHDESISETNKENYKKLKEYLGHTPIEVACGAVLGIVVGLLFKI